MSNLIGQTIEDKYKFIENIGKGSFGEVYKIQDKKSNHISACKVEQKHVKQRLRGEYRIYKRFAIKKLDCVPQVYGYLETPEQNLMIMDLLGKSLDSIFEDNNKKLDLPTVLKLAVTIIDHLHRIHNVGIIHRDIKPNNFMFGVGDKKTNLYVMDFGLSKKWHEGGKHIEHKSGRSMIGTARYASTNIHMGIEPTRRDDLESVGYMLVYFLKGSLPWQGLKKKTKDNKSDKIGEKKMMTDVKTLCEGLPSCFADYINYTKNLGFNEKPEYNFLRDLFINYAKEHKIQLKYFFET
jgi:serine/threonine protein kinase